MVFGNKVQPCPSLDVHINGGTRDPRTETGWPRTRTSEFSKPGTGPGPRKNSKSRTGLGPKQIEILGPIRTDGNPPLSDIDVKNKMAWVRTTLKTGHW